MTARVGRIDPLDLYVTAVTIVGGLCAAALVYADAGDLRLVLTPEVALFAACALFGVLLAALAFFVCNPALVAAVIALVQRASVFKSLAQALFFQAATAGLLLGLAPVVVLAADFALPAIALLFLPLFAVHRGGSQ